MKSVAVRWFDGNAREIAARYEATRARDLHSWFFDFLPKPRGLAIDIGAGSGRDAEWLSLLGFDVVAIEPSSGMRAEAYRLHPDSRVRWIDDRFPYLTKTREFTQKADFILASAVFMFVPPSERHLSFENIISLAKPGGLIAISLRKGPSDAKRGLWTISSNEIAGLARRKDIEVVKIAMSPDLHGRQDISWEYILLRNPRPRAPLGDIPGDQPKPNRPLKKARVVEASTRTKTKISESKLSSKNVKIIVEENI